MIWEKVIEKAEEKNVLRTSLNLKCETHNYGTEIKEIEDWKKVATGGCK